jgi:hypothetical protein
MKCSWLWSFSGSGSSVGGDVAGVGCFSIMSGAPTSGPCPYDGTSPIMKWLPASFFIYIPFIRLSPEGVSPDDLGRMVW